jgi:4-hydroxybenzoate polyprenyltransferase
MSTRPYPIASLGFWRCYRITLRPYLFFVSAASGLVGLALPEGPHWGAFVSALAAFFLSYGLGQALTDVFQEDTDALSSPYRPLVRGELDRRHVALVSLVGLGCCSLILIAMNPWVLVPCALAVGGLLAYTPCKRRWWAGPPCNAAVVALLPAIGFGCVAPTAGASLHSAPLRTAMVSVFASYAVFVLLGYFKDVSADRATGYDTLPVRHGRAVSLLVSLGLTAVALLASVELVRSSGLAGRGLGAASLVTLGLWLGGAVALLGAHGLMLAARRDEDAHGPIAWALRGYLLLHVAEASAYRPVLVWPAIAGYALFEAVLASRPERSQI